MIKSMLKLIVFFLKPNAVLEKVTVLIIAGPPSPY